MRDSNRTNALRRALDRLYADHDFGVRVAHDPISAPARYANPRDVEVAGFVAAMFAYGRVDQFLPVIGRILAAAGGSPHAFVAGFRPSSDARRLSGIGYRFNREADIAAFLLSIRHVLRRFGSLQAAFMAHYDAAGEEPVPVALAGLMSALRSADTSAIYGNPDKPQGLMQLMPTTATGGACKRGNLYLRWMVRDRDIDFGIWRGVDKARLVIPLDTHIARVARCLGLTSRRANDLKTALEITSALRGLDPADPLKYDFALCHRGISGLCASHRCGTCALVSLR